MLLVLIVFEGLVLFWHPFKIRWSHEVATNKVKSELILIVDQFSMLSFGIFIPLNASGGCNCSSPSSHQLVSSGLTPTTPSNTLCRSCCLRSGPQFLVWMTLRRVSRNLCCNDRRGCWCCHDGRVSCKCLHCKFSSFHTLPTRNNSAPPVNAKHQSQQNHCIHLQTFSTATTTTASK